VLWPARQLFNAILGRGARCWIFVKKKRGPNGLTDCERFVEVPSAAKEVVGNDPLMEEGENRIGDKLESPATHYKNPYPTKKILKKKQRREKKKAECFWWKRWATGALQGGESMEAQRRIEKRGA